MKMILDRTSHPESTIWLSIFRSSLYFCLEICFLTQSFKNSCMYLFKTIADASQMCGPSIYIQKLPCKKRTTWWFKVTFFWDGFLWPLYKGWIVTVTSNDRGWKGHGLMNHLAGVATMLTSSNMAEAAIVPLVPCVSVEKLSMASWVSKKNGWKFLLIARHLRLEV